MGKMKPDWRLFRFDQMVTSAGATRKARGWSSEATGVNRYVGLEHLDTNSPTIRRWGSPDDVGENSDLRHFEPGDVILARRGIEQRKVGIATFSGVASGHALIFRARQDIMLPEFLPFFLLSDAFMGRVDQFSAGSLSKTVNLSTLLRLEFALPPLNEQSRMAEALWASTMAVDSASDLIVAAKNLQSSSVNNAVGQAMRLGKIVDLKECIDPDRPITYGILMPGTGFSGGVPVIKVRDYPSGVIQTDNLLLTDPKLDYEYRRSRLQAGDLLISIRGTIGRLAFVPESLAGANITQDTARLSIRTGINPIFIRCLLESQVIKSQIRRYTTGLAVQGLNIGSLRQLKVPLPPLQIQCRIADISESLRDSVIAAERRKQATSGVRTRLLNAALGAV